MPIRNRNIVFSHINDTSHNDDKYFQLPRVAATANAPTASAAINGSLYYDNQTGKLYCCKGGAWKEITVAS